LGVRGGLKRICERWDPALWDWGGTLPQETRVLRPACVTVPTFVVLCQTIFAYVGVAKNS